MLFCNPAFTTKSLPFDSEEATVITRRHQLALSAEKKAAPSTGEAADDLPAAKRGRGRGNGRRRGRGRGGASTSKAHASKPEDSWDDAWEDWWWSNQASWAAGMRRSSRIRRPRKFVPAQLLRKASLGERGIRMRKVPSPASRPRRPSPKLAQKRKPRSRSLPPGVCVARPVTRPTPSLRRLLRTTRRRTRMRLKGLRSRLPLPEGTNQRGMCTHGSGWPSARLTTHG